MKCFLNNMTMPIMLTLDTVNRVQCKLTPQWKDLSYQREECFIKNAEPRYSKLGVPKVVDIDPWGSMGLSKASINTWGSKRVDQEF